jgi:hypothetical protein
MIFCECIVDWHYLIFREMVPPELLYPVIMNCVNLADRVDLCLPLLIYFDNSRCVPIAL